MRLFVGCCGWAVKGGRRAYYERFKTIELQDTFYKLPRVQTAEKWRREAPSDFIFCMKAWQAITHPPTSPTWKRAGVKIPKSKYDKYGGLKPTEENLQAWERTVEIAEAIDAEVIVIQTPASFGYSEENLDNVREFFKLVSKTRASVGWEPRGSWREKEEIVGEICEEYNIIHVVDPFRWIPKDRHKTLYLRLHGIGGGEVNYSYKYTDEDLTRLGNIVSELMQSREKGFVMFNNVSMAVDAERFVKLIG